MVCISGRLDVVVVFVGVLEKVKGVVVDWLKE